MKALLNYTTSIDPLKTVAEINAILVHHGTSSVTVEYRAGRPVGITFDLDSPRGSGTYRLLARVPRVQAVLEKDCKAGKIPPRLASAEQAERVAWRILKDWLQAQLALIRADLVDLDELMLPFLMRGDRSLFEHYVETRKAIGASPDDVR